MDIEFLANPTFCKALCPKCKALVPLLMYPETSIRCKSCGVLWRIEGEMRGWQSFFQSFPDSYIEMEDPIAHAQRLAKIAISLKHRSVEPVRALFLLLQESKYFVHFCTWNVTTDLLAAVAYAALNKPVRGIIGSKTQGYVLDALTTFTKAFPLLEIMNSTAATHDEQAHQKIYVFDGIVAITGSLNLTLSAWSKAESNKEHFEVITALDRTREVNNEGFSTQFRTRSLEKYSEFSVIDGVASPSEIDICLDSANPATVPPEVWVDGKLAAMRESLRSIHLPTWALVGSFIIRAEYGNGMLTLFVKGAHLVRMVEQATPRIQMAWKTAHNEMINVFVKTEKLL